MGVTPVNNFQYRNYKVNNPWGHNVGAVERGQQPTSGGVVDVTNTTDGLARDKFPTAQAFKYHEYLAGGGESNWSIIC